MNRRPVGASRWLRFGLTCLATIVTVMAVTTDPADARHRRKRYHVKRVVQSESYKPKPRVQASARRVVSESSSNPRYADVVMDAKTGELLHQSSPDGLRHPASLTKIMTLYLLFERLESGKVKPWTTMEVSEDAAAQAPTKLGLKPGSEITVDNAIKGLVTRSANDAAVVIAEALGGSEAEFARMMTRKAHQLGMTRTVYRNASGLPDDDQVTTARDQAILGIAIQQRFPTYYRYFSTPSFVWHGVAIRNHNHLLGSVAGVDGIKTGYTRASGFNLVTSIHRADRHVVAVVMGGPSAGSRDARMRALLDAHLMEASIGRSTNTRFAAAAPEPEPLPEKLDLKPAPKTMHLASSISMPAPAPEATATVTAHPTHVAPNLGSNAPIKPIPVKTVAVKLAAKPVPVKVAAKPIETKPVEVKHVETKVAEAKPEPKPEPKAEAHPSHGSKPGVLGRLVVAAGNAIVPSAAAAERPRSGWAIQIGAFEEEGEAKQRLSAARSKAGRALSKADPYTERTTKGPKTYYRARFAGFNERDQAESACKQLKRDNIVCMALKI